MIPIGEGRRLPIFPIVVHVLIALNVYVFISEASTPNIDRFINAWATIPYDLTHSVQLDPPSPPTAATLVTAMFFHGSWLHLGFNMLFLFVFGPQIEYLCGHTRFAALYLAAGLVGNIAQVVVDPASHIPAIGASGAIAGVLGAYIVTFPTARVNTIVPIGCFPLFLQLPAVIVIGLWAATQFMHGYGALTAHVSTEQGGTAYFAHIGGFTFGALTIAWFRIRSGALPRFRYHA